MLNIDITNLRGSLGNPKLNNDNEIKLDDIKHLTNKVRNTLTSLNLSTKNFDNNLKTLQISKRESSYMDNDLKLDSKSLLASSEYNHKYNTITTSNKDDILHELFHVASTNTEVPIQRRTLGLETINHKYTAINEGITDMLTNIADNNSNINYPLEETVASILTSLLGTKLLNAYVNNSSSRFLISIEDDELREDVEYVMETLDKFNKLSSEIFSRQYNSKIQSLLDKAEELSGHFYTILYTLYDICEDINYPKDNLTTFLKNKFNQKQFDIYRSMLDLDKVNFKEFTTPLI